LSVIGQNYPNLEYIIIDGGSTDNSVEIIRKYEKHLAFWISEKDQGQSDAINKGLSVASGDILSWLNSDDFFLPNTLNKVASIWQAKNFDFLIGNVEIVDQNGNSIGIAESKIVFKKNYYMPVSSVILQPASFFSKKVFNSCGGLNNSFHYAMDVDFWIRASLAGYSFEKTDELFAVFRQHKDSKSSNGDLNFCEELVNHYTKTNNAITNQYIISDIQQGYIRTLFHYDSKRFKKELLAFSLKKPLSSIQILIDFLQRKL